MKHTELKIKMKPAEKVTYLPVTQTSHPFGGAKWQVRPMNLEDWGYVEEEYAINGKARIYTWPKGQMYAGVEREDAPYGTRILVRKPADPSKFSGNVIVEMFNWARGYDRTICSWGNCYEHIMEQGDAWIGVSIRASTIDSLKQFDPERYIDLSYENPVPKEHRMDRPQSNTYHDDYTNPDRENGLTWDMYSQVGLLVREQSERNPLYGYDVRCVIGTGATAGDLATYCAAIDPVCCGEDGKNIYDGFLIFMTGAPGNVNQYEEKLYYLDQRCKFYGKVPLIRAYTCKDMLGVGMHPDWSYMQRRPDCDEEGYYYRSYEIAGTGLILKYTYYMEARHSDVERCGLKIRNGRTNRAWTQEELETFEFPTRYALNAMHENLKLWIQKGITPPSCSLYETENMYPDTKLKKDVYGNVLGGLRLPYLRVPAYHFNTDATAYPFEKEIMERLYDSHEDYVRRVKEAAADCVNERILLPKDAEKIIEEAENYRRD